MYVIKFAANVALTREQMQEITSIWKCTLYENAFQNVCNINEARFLLQRLQLFLPNIA